MTYIDQFHADLKRFFNLPDEAEIVSVDAEVSYKGYYDCDTCSYEEAVVVVRYKDAEGKWTHERYSGSFTELMREVTK